MYVDIKLCIYYAYNNCIFTETVEHTIKMELAYAI